MRTNFLLLKNLTILTSIISALAFTRVPSAQYVNNTPNVSDTSSPAQKLATFSPHVQEGDHTFKFLDSAISYQIYLPEGYSATRSRYPVVYLLNGPVFSAGDMNGEDWRVDELLDSLVDAGKQKSIVISFSGLPLPGSNEDSLSRFLATTIKPVIDENYRTQPAQSFIAGTGEYADLALLTSLLHQDKFPRVGVFCPTDAANTLVESHGLNGSGYSGMVFIYKNGSKYAGQLADNLAANSSALLYTRDKENTKSAETPFGGWFTEFFNWVMGNGFNYITK